MIIALDARLSSDLSWPSATASAEAAIARGEKIIWEFEFDLAEVPLDDPGRFYSFSLAIEHFVKMLFKPFADHSLAAILFRGTIDPYHLEVIEDYLHRLASFLPDELAPWILIDTTSLTPSEVALSFCKRHFTHLEIALKGSPLSLSALTWDHEVTFSPRPPIGILLPQAHLLNRPLFESLVQSHQGQIRAIPEERFNEEWDGLDTILIFPETLSQQAKRQLQGFLAAGGTIREIIPNIRNNLEFGYVGFATNFPSSLVPCPPGNGHSLQSEKFVQPPCQTKDYF